MLFGYSSAPFDDDWVVAAGVGMAAQAGAPVSYIPLTLLTTPYV